MEVPNTHEEFLPFDPNSNEKSLRLLDELKFSVLKFALDGADIALKDRRTLKNHLSVSNGIALQEEFHFGLNENGGDGSPNLDTYRVHGGKAFERNINGVRNSLHNWSKSYRNSSKVVNFPSMDYNPLPTKFLSCVALSLIKMVGFQISLFFSFITFPVWLSYVCLMSLLFPLQTLLRIRGYFMKKMLRMWGDAQIFVTRAVSKRVRAQKSMAVRIGFAFLKSMYVFSILTGFLASGFVLGGFMTRKMVEKPIQSREILNFDYSKTSPVAFVPIMSPEVGKQSSTFTIPYNHILQLTVSLNLPESEYNQNLGVFQVRVEFLSANGNVTTSSSRPCMLRFKSLPIRLTQTLLRSVPLVAGFQSESQVLRKHMTEFSQGLEPTACLRVILKQRSEFEPGKGLPQFYSASLELRSELPKLKSFIWYWRRTIFVWCSMVLFFTELVLILALFRPIIVPKITNSRGIKTI